MLTRAQGRMKAIGKEMSGEEREILLDMQEKFLETMGLGFDPKAMQILDNEDSAQREIESIKDMLNPPISARLYGVGNSVYYGRMRKGNVSSFFDVVMRLGTVHTKMYIIVLSLLQMASSADTRRFLARSIATSIMGKIVADKMGLSHGAASRAELAGLFLDIGKMVALTYGEKEQKYRPAEDFPDRFNLFIGLKVVELFRLPPYLNDILLEDAIAFDEESFDVATVVQMARLLVADSFASKGCLSLKVPLPDRDGLAVNHYGDMIREWFRAIGLDEYIEVAEGATERQRRLRADKGD